MQEKIKRFGTAVVLVNAIVIWLHGQAHEKLGVNTFDWPGNSFIYIVIVAAPLIAMILLWTRLQHFGIWLLFGAMAGSLLFGAYNHFIAITSDHVSHLPPGDSQTLFRVTAVLMAGIELLGGWMAWQALRQRRRATVPV